MSRLTAVVCNEADGIVRGAILGFEGLVEKGYFVVGENGV